MARSDDYEVNNGVPLDQQLGYMARSCVVDNLSSSWCYVPAARRYVPPGGGASFSFEGVQNAKLEWKTPPGKTPVAAIPTEVALIVYSESPTPAGAGTASAISVASGPPTNITQIGGGAIALGLAKSASALPVVAAKDQGADLGVTATGAAGAGVTATLAAAGVGLSHYICLITVTRYAIAALGGGGAPLLVTTTNIPGNPVLDFSSFAANESDEVQTWAPAIPIKSAAANTASTIVCPATPNVIWRIDVRYYAA